MQFKNQQTGTTRLSDYILTIKTHKSIEGTSANLTFRLQIQQLKETSNSSLFVKEFCCFHGYIDQDIRFTKKLIK